MTICHALFLLARLVAFEGDASRFVVAGDRWVQQAEAPAGLRVLPDSDGYDGQFYYRLALAPFSFAETVQGIRFDRPVYRQQRILYPLAVHLLSLGRAAAVGWLLIGLNLLGVALLAWSAADVAHRLGRAPGWGLAIAFYPGLLLSLARDLPEACASGLALLALGRWLSGRLVAASVCFVAAALCRETLLLIPCGLAWVELRRAGTVPARRRAFTLLLPALVCLAWRCVLVAAWGDSGLSAAGANFGLPLLGPVRYLRASWPPLLPVQLLGLMQVSLLAFTLGLAVHSVILRRGDPVLRWLWGGQAALFLLLSPEVWLEDYGFMRAWTECHLLACLLLISDGRRRTALAALTLASLVGWLSLLPLMIQRI